MKDTMKFSDLGLHEKYHPESQWMTSPMECSVCHEPWVAVHPICEWLQCICGHWTQVPPLEEDSDGEMCDEKGNKEF